MTISIDKRYYCDRTWRRGKGNSGRGRPRLQIGEDYLHMPIRGTEWSRAEGAQK
jgi:hypothetical protein